MASIWIEFVGMLQSKTGGTKLQINIDAPITVSTMIKRLATVFDLEANLLLDHTKGRLRPNALILVNGREINVLEGLETQVKDEDILTIISVSHGG